MKSVRGPAPDAFGCHSCATKVRSNVSSRGWGGGAIHQYYIQEGVSDLTIILGLLKGFLTVYFFFLLVFPVLGGCTPQGPAAILGEMFPGVVSRCPQSHGGLQH